MSSNEKPVVGVPLVGVVMGSNSDWEVMKNACQQLDTTVLVVTHKIPTIFSLPYRHFIIESKGVYEVH